MTVSWIGSSLSGLQKKEHVRFTTVIHILLIFFSIPVWSAETQLLLKAKKIFNEGDAFSLKPELTNWSGLLRLEGIQYFSELPEAPELSASQFLTVRLMGTAESKYIDGTADLLGGTYFIRNQTFLNARELYLTNHSRGPLKVFAGRKKMDWSELDHRWQLGLFQPRFAIDTLRPDELGLTGFFLNYKSSNFEVLGFATPIYIPNMGPDIREESGGLVSDSRWYRAPSREFSLNNRSRQIVYSLDTPETMKLVGHGGGALMVRAGNKDKGFWMSGSGGYLPVNELVLQRKIVMDASETAADVTVVPGVTYHQIYAMDAGYKVGGVGITLSYLKDLPLETQSNSEDWAVQKLQGVEAMAVALDMNFSGILKRDLFAQLQYLKAAGGKIQDIRYDGVVDDITMFDRRLYYSDALAFQLEGQIARILKRPLMSRFKYIYDYDQQGSLLNFEMLYYPTPKWALIVGGDVLGVKDETRDPSSFLNQYRANDRLYGGLTYVF